MSKAYIHVRSDLATSAAVAAYVLANPTYFGLGAQIIAADGSLTMVIDTSGATSEVATSAPASAEHGAGLIGTGAAPVTTRTVVNGVIITQFAIDLTGLASVATANDVIGLAAGGIAYIRQNDVAVDGIVFKTEMTCLEVPVGGDDDVNLVLHAVADLEYDDAGGTTYGINAGVGVAGKTLQTLVLPPTADLYYYLTAGAGDTAGAYTAGQYLITTYGHPLLT